ncbi:MAG TPA: hypothetical protein VMU47_23640 [Caldimonas sp.]|nr:hypothetical protein [Caldimonas sp.]
MKAAIAILSFAAAVAATPAVAQQPSVIEASMVATAPGKAALTDVATATARVTAINAASRVVTLQGALGKSFNVRAGDDVKNFDQIQVGDDLVITYVDSVMLELQKGGAGIREQIVRNDPLVAETSGKPAAEADAKVTVIADVWAVNRKTHVVTLRGVGDMVRLRIQDPDQLALIKVGDQVKATFVEAVAIALEPASKKVGSRE